MTPALHEEVTAFLQANRISHEKTQHGLVIDMRDGGLAALLRSGPFDRSLRSNFQVMMDKTFGDHPGGQVVVLEHGHKTIPQEGVNTLTGEPRKPVSGPTKLLVKFEPRL